MSPLPDLEEYGPPPVPFVDTDAEPVPSGDDAEFTDDAEGEADGMPVPSVYGSERHEGVE